MATLTIPRTQQATRFMPYAPPHTLTKVAKKRKVWREVECEEEEEKFDLHEALRIAFAEVKLMQEGKMEKKTLDELIEELRNEEQQWQ